MVDGRPHWETRFPEEVWPVYEEFRNFLFHTWEHLGLPEPTPAQYEVAHRLQYGIDSVEFDDLLETNDMTASQFKHHLMYETGPREDIIRAFRSLGKSYVTGAFGTWRVARNPRDEMVLVVSATGSKAKEFVDMVKGLMASMPLIQWMLQGTLEGGVRRRDKADQFDVAGASIKQSYSVKAVGIDGQITGSRATVIIPDDIEILKNSKTEEARTNILRTIRSDFGPVRKTEQPELGDIIFLGTPQTEESMYNVLVKEMMYDCWTFPIKYPSQEKSGNYTLEIDHTKEKVDILAYCLRKKFDLGEIDYGGITDTRFEFNELARLEAQGRAEFSLQYMLDTSLSDAERYPLKQHDFMIFPVNMTKAPLTISWGHHTDKLNIVKDIPNLGFSGDHFIRPLFIDDDWGTYEGRVCWVDPAGRGKDEMAWCIMSQLGGTLWIHKIGSYGGKIPLDGMIQCAKDVRDYEVNMVEVEPNYGQGIWVAAFQPILTNIWQGRDIQVREPEDRISAIKSKTDFVGGCSIQESEWAKGTKELRIIDTLEVPLMTHRLVLDETEAKRQALEDDVQYSFLYQMSHVTRDPKCLRHDDRLECVAGAVNHFMTAMEIDSRESRSGVLESRRDDMVEDFLAFGQSGFKLERGNVLGKQRADGSREDVWQF